MPHMVIFRDAEGKAGYHQSEALDDAVRFVEELRNERQATETRVFSMQEVPIECKSYWKVEVLTGPEPVTAAPIAPVPLVVTAEVEPEPEPDPALEMEPAYAVPMVAAVGVGSVESIGTYGGLDPVGDEVDEEPAEFDPEPAPSAGHSRFGLFGRS